MARKSKAFKYLYQTEKGNQHKQQRSKTMDRLKDRVSQEPMGIDLDRIVQNAPGQPKMSKILREFAFPYLSSAEDVNDEEECQHLCDLSIMAWNAAVLSPSNPLKACEEQLDESGIGEIPGLKSKTMKLVKSMINRKKKHFAKYKRFVLDYIFEDRGDDYYLSVVSSPDLDSEDAEDRVSSGD